LTPADLGTEFSFCHVDGGHSARETYHDLDLCHRILVPGGLLAVDDYFNPAFPGVCEGAIGFQREHEDALTPIAIGFNKVLFQKAPAPFDLNGAFSRTFPAVPKTAAVLWERPAFLFGSDLMSFFDLARSTPRRLVPSGEFRLGAILVPQITDLKAERGATVRLPIGVSNRSTIPFQWGSTPFGLSYHLLSSDGTVLQFDNVRSFFTQPLHPGGDRVVDLSVLAPEEAGSYKLEIDIVWDGILWLKDRGNPTAVVDLTVT
jgi:hypothetical protein